MPYCRVFTLQRKTLVIYVHNDRSISSDDFIRTVLSNEAIIKELEQHCVLWPFNVTEESNKSKLLSSLQQCAELNAPPLTFPKPFGERNPVLSASQNYALASHMCGRISSFSSPNEFPRLYIVISSAELIPKLSTKKLHMSLASKSSSIVSASASSPPLLSTSTSVTSNFPYSVPLAASSSRTSSSVSTHFSQIISGAPKATGIAVSAQSDHLSNSSWVFEVEGSTTTATQLLLSLQRLHKNRRKLSLYLKQFIYKYIVLIYLLGKIYLFFV